MSERAATPETIARLNAALSEIKLAQPGMIVRALGLGSLATEAYYPKRMACSTKWGQVVNFDPAKLEFNGDLDWLDQ